MKQPVRVSCAILSFLQGTTLAWCNCSLMQQFLSLKKQKQNKNKNTTEESKEKKKRNKSYRPEHSNEKVVVPLRKWVVSCHRDQVFEWSDTQQGVLFLCTGMWGEWLRCYLPLRMMTVKLNILLCGSQVPHWQMPCKSNRIWCFSKYLGALLSYHAEICHTTCFFYGRWRGKTTSGSVCITEFIVMFHKMIEFSRTWYLSVWPVGELWTLTGILC